ncbi:STN domain-containing protein, partial [Chitinophaga sp.]
MKLTALLLLSACMCVSAKTLSQQVTISEKNAPLEKVFREIKRQTGYSFVYTARQLEKAAPVTLTVKNSHIREVLEACFRNQPLIYTLLDDMVIVKEKLPAIPRYDLPATPPPVKVKG